MTKLILLLLLVVSGLPFHSLELFAQQVHAPETVDHQLARLRFRFEAEDVDGIGELIGPLFAQLAGKEKSSLDLAQRHLIAMAKVKFELASGDHHRAILPFLIALHLQSELLEQPHHRLLVEPLDETETFRTQYLPTLFFTAEDRSYFRKQFDDAVANGACLQTELSEEYYKAGKKQQSRAQQKILDAISLVKENPQPTDREIYKLLDHFVAQWKTHPTLANQCLKTAIEGLMNLKRTAEADRLKSVHQARLHSSLERRLSLGRMPE